MLFRSERARLLNAADVAFLCLPDAAAREAAALVANPRTCLIDASTAHRTAPGWVFGLPELAPGQRDALRQSKRIANPGCHASAFILLLRPLVDAGLVPPDALLSATSITGYSGGGKKMIEAYRGALPGFDALGLAGVIQIASFHPDYQFAGTQRHDVTNYTNRSPHPMLQLLREASVSRAVAAFPEAQDIYKQNIETMRRLGTSGWTALGVGEPVEPEI